MNKEIEILSEPEKVDMADDWYQYANLNHFWIKSRYTAAVSRGLLKTLNGKKIFEIGCGNGMVIRQFEESLNATVDGCDLNLYALEQVQNTRGRLFCLNIFDKPEKLLCQYDAVLLMDVIEHIDDDLIFLKSGLQYLRNDGLVVINVPALNSLFSRYDEAAGHKRRYNKQMIRKLFEASNIEEVSIQYWGISLLPIALLRKIILRFVPKENTIAVGFKPPGSFVNWLFDGILHLENRFLKSPILGTSLMAVGRKRPIENA